jgi:aryl-alcohol dehydrogenase-like predicted oxidoreductase
VRYARFAPLGRDLSRLVLGTLVYRDASPRTEAVLLDAWLDAGGNAIDTGREYGAAEAFVGRWLAERGCRDDVVLITKACHPEGGRTRVTPADLAADVEASLAALGCGRLDVLLLHRDDPARPAGTILHALDEHRAAGRIGVAGASNWTTGRLEEAVAHARAHGLAGFSCASPGMSLAVANEPPWPGCVTAGDRASRAWYERAGMPVLAWSAQAGGFFAGAGGAHVDRVYGGPANAERARRARSLGAARGASANQVALAWLLHQPFRVHPIIGPRTVAELDESLGALEIELQPDELRWLALDDVRE